MGIKCCSGDPRKEPEICKEAIVEIDEEAESSPVPRGESFRSLASMSTQSSCSSPTSPMEARTKRVSFDLGNGSTYQGEWLNGMRDGKGKHKDKEGLHYTGEWLADIRHGFGKQEFDNGDVYFGQWRDDLQEGNGTLQREGYKYVGQWSLGLKHGIGKEYWVGDSNDTPKLEYEGEFKFGHRSGFGTMKYADGSVYVGNWSQGKRCGVGALTLDVGEYTGTWFDDTMHGYGKLLQNDGTSYIGEVKYGTMDGKGKLTQKDGSYFDGYWRQGVISGTGTRYYARKDRTRRESWYKGKFIKVMKDVKFK